MHVNIYEYVFFNPRIFFVFHKPFTVYRLFFSLISLTHIWTLIKREVQFSPSSTANLLSERQQYCYQRLYPLLFAATGQFS